MAHTFPGPSGAYYHRNLDMSGAVRVSTEYVTVEHGMVYIPGEDILALVADHVRSEKIAALERASDAKILGLEER